MTSRGAAGGCAVFVRIRIRGIFRILILPTALLAITGILAKTNMGERLPFQDAPDESLKIL